MTWSFSIPHFGPRPPDHPSILGLPTHMLLPLSFNWSRSFCWWELVDLGAFLSAHTYSREWFLAATPGTESLVCDPVKLTCPIINNCSLMGCHATAFRLVWGKVLMTVIETRWNPSMLGFPWPALGQKLSYIGENFSPWDTSGMMKPM